MKKTVDSDRGSVTTVGHFRIYLDGLEQRPDSAVHEFNRFTGYKLREEWIASNNPSQKLREQATRYASQATAVLKLIHERVPGIDKWVEDYNARLEPCSGH